MKLRNSPIAISLGGAVLVCIVVALMALGFAWKGLVGLLLGFCVGAGAAVGFISALLSGERQAANSELSGAPEGGQRHV